MYRLALVLFFAGLVLVPPLSADTENGWYVQNNKIIWGYGQHNGWWLGMFAPNITRKAPAVGPLRRENLGALADSMLRWGYPGFEHNYGLWYDRRRHFHDPGCRSTPPVGPFLVQPWARSGAGMACDGGTRYDLKHFDRWYFRRLKQFARIAQQKSVLFFNNHYMQHALLENQAHYEDFPWRPINTKHNTGMPLSIPAANTFYDISNPARKKLHRRYIRKVLSALRDYPEVVHLLSEEYTGPVAFAKFWIDTVHEWERNTGHDVHIGLGATKDVLDAILADRAYKPLIDTIDLRYFWYRADGTLNAPRGGREVPGRYTLDGSSAETTPEQLYRQIRSYRKRFPEKAIIHQVETTLDETWAFLMAGGSLLLRLLNYPPGTAPKDYVAPPDSRIIKPTYDFIRTRLADTLYKSRPRNDFIVSPSGPTWGLAAPGELYLVYALRGGQFELDLSGTTGRYKARWVNPRTGRLHRHKKVAGGISTSFRTPSTDSWALWLDRISKD